MSNVAVFDKKDVPLTEEECEQYHIVKKKMLGNIKFIGKSLTFASKAIMCMLQDYISLYASRLY